MQQDDLIRVVVVGHVDHGKSTLIGRLLDDTGQLSLERKQELEKASKEHGRRFEYAYATDQFEEERADNITIDTTQTYLKIKEQHFLIIDAPGHKEYLKNMVTGATQAHFACLMLDIKEGIQEQTDKHARLLKLLGINSTAVFINKMDLVNYDQDVFEKCHTEIEQLFLRNEIKLEGAIPLAAYEGENVVRNTRMPWYKGATVAEWLLSLAAKTQVSAKQSDLIFPVQLVHQIDGKSLVLGRVEQGQVEVGEELHSFRLKQKVRVKSIENYPQKESKASIGECIAIEFDTPIKTQRGDIFIKKINEHPSAQKFFLQSFWAADASLKKDDLLELDCRTQTATSRVVAISDEWGEKAMNQLSAGDLGMISVLPQSSILLDLNSLSRVVYRRGNQVVGCGVVTKLGIAFVMVCLLSVSSWAYVDPGTGFSFASGILGYLLGVVALAIGFLAVTFKRWMNWFKVFFRGSSKEK